jgi:hypothetical protein
MGDGSKKTPVKRSKKAPVKKSAAIKKDAVKTAPSATIRLQKPGEAASAKKLAPGATLGSLIDNMNLASYTVTVNGQSVNNSYVFKDKDIVRIGLKTKNG